MNKLKMKLKSREGITLISLVVTIIILIILASISISMILGNNGLLNKAQTASDETKKSQATETMNLKITNIQISSYAETQQLPNLQYLADKLCEDNDMEYVLTASKEHASLDKIDVTNISSIFTKLKEYPYEFEINSSLQLASIDGEKIANQEKTNSVSELINNYKIKVSATGVTAKIELDGDISTTDNSKIAGYIVVINGKAVTVTTELPTTYLLTPNSENRIKIIAIDELSKLKISNECELSIPNIQITPLKYPIITTEGMVNVQYKDLTTNQTWNALNLNYDCTATDALDKKAYDNNFNTFVDVSTGKIRFNIGESINWTKLKYKLSNNVSGRVLDASGGYLNVNEGTFDSNGYWFRDCSGNVPDTCFKMRTNTYEILYLK